MSKSTVFVPSVLSSVLALNYSKYGDMIPTGIITSFESDFESDKT